MRIPKVRNAFTMIELIFVIVVIGILASIAVPRFAATRDDATFVRAKSQVAAIRSGIALQRSQNMLQGLSAIPARLDSASASASIGTPLFYFNDGNASNILQTPILVDNNAWTKTGVNAYSVNIGAGQAVPFIYNGATGTFGCNINDADPTIAANCRRLMN